MRLSAIKDGCQLTSTQKRHLYICKSPIRKYIHTISIHMYMYACMHSFNLTSTHFHPPFINYALIYFSLTTPFIHSRLPLHLPVDVAARTRYRNHCLLHPVHIRCNPNIKINIINTFFATKHDIKIEKNVNGRKREKEREKGSIKKWKQIKKYNMRAVQIFGFPAKRWKSNESIKVCTFERQAIVTTGIHAMLLCCLLYPAPTATR